MKARKTTLWCLTSWFGPLSLCSTVVRVLLSRSTGNLNSILRREAQTTIQALLVLTYHRLPQTDKCRHQHPKTRLLFFFFPCPVKSLTSEATHSATQFFKRSKKLAILPDYMRPGMLCLALPACCKVPKLDFQSEFSMSKIIGIFLIFFFIEE